MSELSVGQLKGLPVNNNVVTVPAGNTLYAPGHVIQVQAFNSTSLAVTTTSGSFQPTGLTVSITPKSTSSKIVVVASNTYWSASGNIVFYTLYRDSTNLGGTNGLALNGATTSQLEAGGHLTYIDSPNTTSAVTYALYFRSHNGGIVYSQNGNNKASIMVMEIAA